MSSSATSEHLFHPRYLALPRHLLARDNDRWAVAHYLVEGAVLPQFMRAVAAGDLYEADRLRPHEDLRPYLDFFAAMPSPSHGNYWRVLEWEMIGGLDGILHLNECLGRIYE